MPATAVPPVKANHEAFRLKANHEAFRLKASDILANLYERWEDEREYEDINTYLEPFKAFAPAMGVTLHKITGSPFALDYQCDGKDWRLKVKATATRLSVEQYSLHRKPKA